MQYKIGENSHTIIRHAVHLPLQQNVCYHDGNEQRALQVGRDTTLIAFLKLNEEDENARQFLYQEIPEHYTFNKLIKKWSPGQHQTGPIIGRLYHVQPSDPSNLPFGCSFYISEE